MIKLNHLFSIEDLISKLKENGYTEFSDEKHRAISLDLFIPLFIYKYGSLNDFSCFIERRRTCFGTESEDKYTLTCESFGFRYCFPIYSDKEL